MKYIGLMDTSVMSFNIGDQIIMESARLGLMPILKDAFVVTMPTHSPLFHVSEFSIRKIDSFRESLNMLDYKFVCGTNLLEKNMKKRKNTWNIHCIDTNYVRDFILVGVGTDSYEIEANGYTKKLYKIILSDRYIHSVRDEKTKIFLDNLGIKSINTGCPTLWGFNKTFCDLIPEKKAKKVVFTITDYCVDKKSDGEMIEILCDNYEEVVFWPQGIKDLEYYTEINKNERIKILTPSLEAYDQYLLNNDCDYIGTRLHAGIKAMQRKKRSVIIGVDNRAKDMHETYKFNYLERNSELANRLTKKINDSFHTYIEIDHEKIEVFLSQFK